MIRARLHRRPKHGDAAKAQDEVVEIDPGELSGIFNTPPWRRDMGLTAWLLVGVTLLLVVGYGSCRSRTRSLCR
jgi:hypothetical protein